MLGVSDGTFASPPTGAPMTRLDNIANTVAARFHDDGQCMEDLDGVHIYTAAELLRVRRSVYGDGVVYEFADSSAIAVTGGGWDTVAWDADDGAFYSVELSGQRNASGWRFPAA